jgi:hypothetical protein
MRLGGGRHINRFRKGVLTDSHGLEPIFQQDHAWVNQGDFSGHGGTPSVVIDNFNVGGMAIDPHKANSPLCIDANAMLALPVAFEGFKLVAWWQP